jgi:hypothetical protein
MERCCTNKGIISLPQKPYSLIVAHDRWQTVPNILDPEVQRLPWSLSYQTLTVS